MTHSPGTTISRRVARRQRRALCAAMALPSIAWIFWAMPLQASHFDFQVFNDREHFSAVLLQQGRVQLDADWNEEGQGSITGGRRALRGMMAAVS